jgi:hypothetical protein
MANIRDIFVIHESVTVRVDGDLYDVINGQILGRYVEDEDGRGDGLMKIVSSFDDALADAPQDGSTDANVQHVQISEDQADEIVDFIDELEKFSEFAPGTHEGQVLGRFRDELIDQLDRKLVG